MQETGLCETGSRVGNAWQLRKWLLDRPDTPRYPAMRLFRRVSRGNWEELIGRVAEESARA
jgi:hypothetical protein